MPAVLTHGDLWTGNLVSRAGRVAVIDPAVSYAWAETDLSMLWSSPRSAASDRFFEVYQELSPSLPGGPSACPADPVCPRSLLGSGDQDRMKASRSLLMVSACVVGIPCGKPG